jgi:ATP/maltotriose-dependent transcriptional regulator MalT
MKTPVSLSKILSPDLPPIVHRSHLFDLLEKNRDKKLILVLGQTAQGKTTLAASYVRQSKIPSAWVNLGQEDSDPVNLFLAIVHAFQYALKDLDLSDLLSYPSIPTGGREEMLLYREWTSALSEYIHSPIRCILDGLDRLAHDSPVYRFLQVFVDALPPHAQIFFLSRGMPPLSFDFQTLKMRQAAFILKNGDLAFTRREIKEFFYKLRKINFDPDQLEKIHSATGGWVGGLILLSESLSRFPEAMRKSFIARDLPDHFKNEVFQYFGREIFDAQPGKVQEFLLKSSLIDLIDSGFIKEFTGTDNAEEILRDHVRKNLFVQSFYDEKKGWLFRYHQMFRDFLQAKLKVSIGEEERASLCFKAATLYERRNEQEMAIHYFLEAGAFENAALAIERIGLDLLKTGRTGDLSQWIQSLPEKLIQENPWLLYYRSMVGRFTGTEEDLNSLQKALSLFGKKEEVRGLLLSLALLIETSILRGRAMIPLPVLIERAEELLGLPETEPYPYEKAVLWHQMGFGLTYRNGDPRKGFYACQNAYWISRKLDDTPLRIHALVNAVHALCWLGEFKLAESKIKELEKLIGKHPDSSVRVLYQLSRCEFTLFKGDFKEAEEIITTTKNEAERHGLTYLFPVTMVYDLMLKPHLEQYREAEEVGARLMDFANSTGHPNNKGDALLYLGRNFYFEGNYEKAKDLLDRSFQILCSAEVRSEYHLHLITVLSGFIASHLPQNENLERDLQTTLNYLLSLSSNIALDAHFAMALLKHSQARDEEVIPHLEAGLRIAEEKRIDNFTMTSPRDLLQVCILALTLEVRGAVEYATHLLNTRLAPLAEQELKKFKNYPIVKIRNKINEIRKTIHRSKVLRLRIQTLGRFRVFRGESPIEEKEWVRQQPKQLLKVILSHGTGVIPKGVLIEVDPLLEESYQKLMTLYATRGMNNEALAVYETCKRVLKKELKTRPDPMTEAIYKNILESLNKQ